MKQIVLFVEKVGSAEFCAASLAVSLAEAARTVGGGSTFSVATVFARQEYESWLIAGMASFAGKTFPDGRIAPAHVAVPEGDLEESPRDAKGWLNKAIPGGYKPTRDQVTLSQWLDLQVVRERDMRSFRRLESAVSELAHAIRSENHIASPSGT